MKLSELKQVLNTLSQINFIQPNGHFVPRHFHITEAGLNTKHFMDCGGTIRIEKTVCFQVWTANDFKHRLEPQKLKKIITTAEPLFGNDDLDIEIEFQTETISRYGLDFDGNNFLLVTKMTNCLAEDHCGIPREKLKMNLSELQKTENSTCSPNSNCC